MQNESSIQHCRMPIEFFRNIKSISTPKIVKAYHQVEFTDEDAKILEHVFEETKKRRKDTV